MQQLIEQLAKESGITIDEAEYIFTAIANRLTIKIPALQQVIEDVFENVEDETFNDHINKLIFLLQQQQCRETFKTWKMPPQAERISFSGNNDTVF